MKKLAVLLILCFSTINGFSQQKSAEQLEREARENVREGNKLYNQLKFSEAEIAYKKALSKNPNYPKATYNLGNAVYQQQRNKEAVSQFELVEKTVTDKQAKAETYHNMGNSFMNEKQYDKAVEAYKNSLKNNPNDDETRYNFALAKKLLKQQQDQQKKDDKNKKDNKDDKNQKDKDGGDKDKEQDKKDQKDQGKDKQDDKGDPKKPKDDKNKEQQKQQPRPNQLTPEQMKQMLEAMNNEENKTQKKLNAQKAKGKKIKQEKDW